MINLNESTRKNPTYNRKINNYKKTMSKDQAAPNGAWGGRVNDALQTGRNYVAKVSL